MIGDDVTRENRAI